TVSGSSLPGTPRSGLPPSVRTRWSHPARREPARDNATRAGAAEAPSTARRGGSWSPPPASGCGSFDEALRPRGPLVAVIGRVIAERRTQHGAADMTGQFFATLGHDELQPRLTGEFRDIVSAEYGQCIPTQ